MILHLSTSSLMRVKLNHFFSMLSNAWHLLHEKIGGNRRPWWSIPWLSEGRRLLSVNPAKYGWLTTLAPWYYIGGFISRTPEKKFCFRTTKFITAKQNLFYVRLLDIRTLDSLRRGKKKRRSSISAFEFSWVMVLPLDLKAPWNHPIVERDN